jgi:predicted RNase H-like HicB family nuclease
MTSKYRINLFWSEADGAWVADVPDLRSCAAFDDTPAQALAEIERAIESRLAVAIRRGCQSRSRAIMLQSTPPADSTSNTGELS